MQSGGWATRRPLLPSLPAPVSLPSLSVSKSTNSEAGPSSDSCAQDLNNNRNNEVRKLLLKPAVLKVVQFRQNKPDNGTPSKDLVKDSDKQVEEELLEDRGMESTKLSRASEVIMTQQPSTVPNIRQSTIAGSKTSEGTQNPSNQQAVQQQSKILPPALRQQSDQHSNVLPSQRQQSDQHSNVLPSERQQSVNQQSNVQPSRQQPISVVDSSVRAPPVQAPAAAATGGPFKDTHRVRYFSDSILSMNLETWTKLGSAEKEQVLFNFWIQTSYDEGFPWTMNLVLQKNPTTSGALGAFMLLFSEGKHLSKDGVTWKTLSKDEFDNFRVECIWSDQRDKKHHVEGTGSGQVEFARRDAAQKALKIIFCAEDLRVLEHVNKLFLRICDRGPHWKPINLLWNRLKEAKLQQNRMRSSQYHQLLTHPRSPTTQMSCSRPLPQAYSACSSARSTEFPNNQSVRYFDDNILKVTPEVWRTLRKDEKEQILFDFWIKTSWGEGFPWTMNLMQQKLLGGGALGAFMLLFSEGKNLDKEGVHWRTISQEKDAVTVECCWHDQWNNVHRVGGIGKMLDHARIDAAQKALRVVFSLEDLDVLNHVHSPFIYDYENPRNQRVNLNLLWNRLKEVKIEENRQREQLGKRPEGRQRILQYMPRADVHSTTNLRANGNVATLTPEKSTEVLCLSHNLISNSQQLSGAGRTTEASCSRPDRQTNLAQRSAESADSPSINSKNDQPVRYFDDSILKVTPKSWQTLSKDEREQVLFDFWIKTSWGEGFPWTMNLVQQRSFMAGGALPAFMLLFSEGRNLYKEGLEWQTISRETDLFKVACTWHDQWNHKHYVEGTGRTIDHARTDAAEKALRTVFCLEDLEALHHVHSPFIYGGPQSHRVNVGQLYDRLKEAKLQEKREQAGQRPGGRASELHRSPRIAEQNASISKRQGSTGSSVSSTSTQLPPTGSPAQRQESSSVSNLPTPQPVTETQYPQGATAELPSVTATPESQGANTELSSVTATPESQGADAELPSVTATPESQGANAELASVTATPESQGANTELPSVTVTPESPGGNVQPPSNPTLDDPFAEYFSNNEDGTLDTPEWIIEKYKKPSIELMESPYDDNSNSEDAILSTDKTDHEADIPYLPFDRIIAYEYPQEAVIALQLLFKGNKHTEPQFDVTKYFLAEFQVGSQVFQALGLTEKEAQEAAAAKALEALSDNQEDFHS